MGRSDGCCASVVGLDIDFSCDTAGYVVSRAGLPESVMTTCRDEEVGEDVFVLIERWRGQDYRLYMNTILTCSGERIRCAGCMFLYFGHSRCLLCSYMRLVMRLPLSLREFRHWLHWVWTKRVPWDVCEVKRVLICQWW